MTVNRKTHFYTKKYLTHKTPHFNRKSPPVPQNSNTCLCQATHIYLMAMAPQKKASSTIYNSRQRRTTHHILKGNPHHCPKRAELEWNVIPSQSHSNLIRFQTLRNLVQSFFVKYFEILQSKESSYFS